jgi:hypothetical protein
VVGIVRSQPHRDFSPEIKRRPLKIGVLTGVLSDYDALLIINV